MKQQPHAVPLFGAEDLRKIERINEEIARNGRAGLRKRAELPLFTEPEEAPDGPE